MKKPLSIYEASSYRDFLADWIESRAGGGRGLRTRMAEEIGAGSGFVTQVFAGASQFSLEQGLRLARWMALGARETEFFILLLEHDRAGTPDLRQHFQSKMARMQEENKKLSHRLETKSVPTALDPAVYFSSWAYAGVHVALTCEGLDTEASLAKKLHLPPAQVRKVLEFLVAAGLAKLENGRYLTGEARMHLGVDSPWLLRHHLNWSLRALAAAEADLGKGTHYSSVVSLAKKDHKLVREILTDAIDRIKKIVSVSPGESVYGFTLNLFEV